MDERKLLEVGSASRTGLDRLALQIMLHERAYPDDFDGREAMWMEREALRAKREHGRDDRPLQP